MHDYNFTANSSFGLNPKFIHKSMNELIKDGLLKLHFLYILRDQEHQDIENIEYELINTTSQF